MTLLAGWPSTVDDSGGGQDGTVVNDAFMDAIKASIEDQVHSATNTTRKPKDTTDEVVTARGNKVDLNTRISSVIDADGNLVLPASLVTQAIAKTIIGSKNLAPNSDFLLWSGGDAAAPDYWILSGTGATIARTGTGLGDTQKGKYGDFAVKLTYGSATAVLSLPLLNNTDFAARATGLKLRKISIGAWIKTGIANHAQLLISDGVTSTAATHTGSGNLEWVTVTHTISNSATQLTAIFQVIAAGSAYVANVMPVLSDIPPADFIPCAMQKGAIVFKIVGNVSTGTDKDRYISGAPGIVTDVQLEAKTAPTGAALIVDVNTWDGGAFTSMFSTRPQIAISANRGGAAPDSTYARRCLSALFGTSLAAGGLLSFDVDQVGSTITGADLTVTVRVRQDIRELEALLAYNTI
jgi:hypothetical protein